MPTDLKAKRYVAASFSACAAIAGNALGTKIDVILGAYSDSLGGY